MAQLASEGIRSKSEKRQRMKERAEAKHMKSRAVTCKKCGSKKKIQKKKNMKKQSTKAAKVTNIQHTTLRTGCLKEDQDIETSSEDSSDVDTKKTTTVNKPDKQKPKERLPSFGSKDTVVLMMMGASDNEKEKSVFKNDMEMMQKLFEDEKYFGVRPDNILVSPSSQHPNSTNRGLFMKMVKVIKDRLKNIKKSRLIFYYTGHFSDSSFWIENDGTPDDYLRDEDLKRAIEITCPEYIIFILDCCSSAKAEMGAKGEKKTYGNPPIPQLWDIGGKGVPRGKGSGSSKYRGIKKAVQLCSSPAGKTSGYGDKNSFFTETIYDVVTKPSKELKKHVPPGCCASVLQIFREVKKELKHKQKAEVRPTSAYREQYYELFPGFTKIKIRQKIPTPSTSTAADGNEVFPQGISSLAANLFIPNFELHRPYFPGVSDPNKSVFSFHPYKSSRAFP